MAEWLGRGLQNLAQQFDSASDLSYYKENTCRGDGMVDIGDLKSPGASRVGSSPTLGTKKLLLNEEFSYFLEVFEKCFTHSSIVECCCWMIEGKKSLFAKAGDITDE